MRTLLIILLLVGVSTGGVRSTPASSPISTVLGPEIVLHLKSTLISGNAVKIGYEIPYDGYIEFVLFNGKGEKIWYSSSVREKGEHFQAVKRNPLEANATYSFEFWYKGKKYSGSFNNS